MNAPAVVAGLLVMTGSLAAAAVHRWQSALPHPTPRPASIMRLRVPSDSGSQDSLVVAEEMIASNDPFRLANAPTAVRYDPALDGPQSSGVAAPIVTRPTLVLKAIVGGPPWQALIDGIPGQPPGTIVRIGNTFDKLTVRAITRDSIVIKGLDTTWTLSFRSRP